MNFIEKNNKTYINAQAIMLGAKGLNNLAIIREVGVSNMLPFKPNTDAYLLDRVGKVHIIPQHIYIVTDEEKKDGDWCICVSDVILNNEEDLHIGDKGYVNPIVKWDSINTCAACKKIVATTDKDLVFEKVSSITASGTYTAEFPKITREFIQCFISKLNLQLPILDVLIEVSVTDYIKKMYEGDEGHEALYIQLKTSKDNFVNIIQIDENWDEIFMKFFAYHQPLVDKGQTTGDSLSMFRDWLKKEQYNPPAIKTTIYVND